MGRCGACRRRGQKGKSKILRHHSRLVGSTSAALHGRNHHSIVFSRTRYAGLGASAANRPHEEIQGKRPAHLIRGIASLTSFLEPIMPVLAGSQRRGQAKVPKSRGLRTRRVENPPSSHERTPLAAVKLSTCLSFD